MPKRILFALWLIFPVLLLAYHYGPGQSNLMQENVAQKLAEARALESAEDWVAVMKAYDEALGLVPSESNRLRFQLLLAKAKARAYTGELPEAIQDLENLLEAMQREAMDTTLIGETRGNLATAQYYAAWLMRLEGAATGEWMLPVENARQHFRLLAEESSSAGQREDYQKNLEATIRLARMDLSELEGMPLPKFCQGCKNVSQKCRSQRESQCKAQGKKEGEQKPKDARGAGFQERPKGGS